MWGAGPLLPCWPPMAYRTMYAWLPPPAAATSSRSLGCSWSTAGRGPPSKSWVLHVVHRSSPAHWHAPLDNTRLAPASTWRSKYSSRSLHMEAQRLPGPMTCESHGPHVIRQSGLHAVMCKFPLKCQEPYMEAGAGPVLPKGTYQPAGPALCTTCSPRDSGSSVCHQGALPAVVHEH